MDIDTWYEVSTVGTYYYYEFETDKGPPGVMGPFESESELLDDYKVMRFEREGGI
jgi:hypothetical protein|tara:strand:+ start:4239 stop:4403 length:165 start_codon:yes stop_codon:yes gene_type:complete